MEVREGEKVMHICDLCIYEIKIITEYEHQVNVMIQGEEENEKEEKAVEEKKEEEEKEGKEAAPRWWMRSKKGEI